MRAYYHEVIWIAEAEARSTAAPAAFFARWADTTTWPDWNTDTEWVRLDGRFVAGATGVLKPKGGPRVKFVTSNLSGGRERTLAWSRPSPTARHLPDRPLDRLVVAAESAW